MAGPLRDRLRGEGMPARAGSGRLAKRLRNRGVRRRERIGAVLLGIGDAFGADDLDVGDAQESEHVAQVSLLEISGAGVAVDAPTTAGDDQALAAGQAVR